MRLSHPCAAQAAALRAVLDDRAPPAADDATAGTSASPAVAITVGDRVEADYALEGNYYPGAVAAVNDDGTFDVRYDDGERESNVSASAIIFLASPPTAPALAVGDRVEADYGLEGNYYPGAVAAVNDDGSVDVAYDDGELESKVAPAHVRSLAAPSAPSDDGGADLDAHVDASSDDDDDDDDLVLPLPLHDLVAKLGDLAMMGNAPDPIKAAAYLAQAAAIAAADPLYAAHANSFLQRAGELEQASPPPSPLSSP